MRKNLTQTVESNPTLKPFVRKGIEGGCIACRKPISTHVDSRGTWIGCQAAGIPPDTPFLLIPDRRYFVDRRVTPEPDGPKLGNGNGNGHTHERRSTEPISARVKPDGQERQARSKPTHTQESTTAQPRAITGPQVAYVARYPLTSPTIDRLPPHDRKVYGLIARNRTNGATRTTLLDHLNAHKHTGRVDGAVRRLRLRKVIKVVTLPTTH